MSPKNKENNFEIKFSIIKSFKFSLETQTYQAEININLCIPQNKISLVFNSN